MDTRAYLQFSFEMAIGYLSTTLPVNLATQTSGSPPTNANPATPDRPRPCSGCAPSGVRCRIQELVIPNLPGTIDFVIQRCLRCADQKARCDLSTRVIAQHASQPTVEIVPTATQAVVVNLFLLFLLYQDKP